MTIIFYLICVACIIAQYKIYSNRLEQCKYEKFKTQESLENALMDIAILEETIAQIEREGKKRK